MLQLQNPAVIQAMVATMISATPPRVIGSTSTMQPVAVTAMLVPMAITAQVALVSQVSLHECATTTIHARMTFVTRSQVVSTPITVTTHCAPPEIIGWERL